MNEHDVHVRQGGGRCDSCKSQRNQEHGRSAQRYLLMVLPKFRTSISSSKKRTSASSMALLLGVSGEDAEIGSGYVVRAPADAMF